MRKCKKDGRLSRRSGRKWVKKAKEGQERAKKILRGPRISKGIG
jgi:hypothetical protein